jgi:hypothetical protein
MQEKLAARAKREVYLERGLRPQSREAAARKLCELLTTEHPTVYSMRGDALHCELTGETRAADLREVPMLMTADVAVVQIDEDGDRLAAGHICIPSSWRLEEKVGRPFAEVHAPVPGISMSGAEAMMRSLASKGPYERYAWGMTNFDLLDQEAGAHADVAPDPLFVRIERQTTHPLAGCDAWLFTIHPRNVPAAALTGGQREGLARAIESMTEEQAEYKGLARTRRAVAAGLRSGVL